MNESDHINKSEERDYIQENNRAIRQPTNMNDLYEQYDLTHTPENRLSKDMEENEQLLN